MITCALCGQNKEPKNNTHYVSDFLIRTALNEDGVNIKNKGLYWTFPTDSPFIEFNYQQASRESVEAALGREATEEENEKSKLTPDFSIDGVFCKQCEDKFGVVETAFADKFSKKFRKANLDGIEEIILNEKESELFRMFFLMQVWRTSICEPSFNISPDIQEILRTKIFNEDYTDLEKLPLSVTYLQTLKDEEDVSEGDGYKTQNIVGIVEGGNPHIMVLNDFVLSFYDNDELKFDRFKGFFKEDDYIKYLNLHELDYKVKVIPDAGRREILNNHFIKEANRMKIFRGLFFVLFKETFKQEPTLEIEYAFWNEFAGNPNMNKYTKLGFGSVIDDFFENVAKANGYI